VAQQVAGMVLSLMYFGVPPTVFSAVLTVCIVVATSLAAKSSRAVANA